MSRVCEICGKGPSVGNVVVRKGSPKYKGGIGLLRKHIKNFFKCGFYVEIEV